MNLQPRKVDKPLVLYGYGKLGHLAEEVFKKLRIPYAILDKDGWIKVLPFTLPLNKTSLLAICVGSESYTSVTAPLIAADWKDIMPVWDIIEAYPEIGIHNGWFVGEVTDEDDRECGKLVWDDEESFMHRWAFVNWHMNREEYPKIVIDKTPDSDRAVLPSTLIDIEARRKVETYFPRDFPISIHAEGLELETLKLNMPLFIKRRPRMKVACYHSRDGLWKIPKILMENLKDYIFMFRMTAYMGTGAYVYCVPKERV